MLYDNLYLDIIRESENERERERSKKMDKTKCSDMW